MGTGAESEGNVYGSNNQIAENIPAAFEARAYAVEDQEDIREPVYITVYQPPPAAEEPKKWHERRLFRVLLAISCLLAILVVVGVVALAMYLSKPAGVTPPPTQEPTSGASTPTPLTQEQIACNFLSISNATKCRSTVKFV